MHYIADITVAFIYTNCKFPVPTGPNFVVDNMLKVFDTFVRQWKPTEDDSPNLVPPNAEELMTNALIFAFVWGIGAQIDENTRQSYDLFLQDALEGQVNMGEKYHLELGEGEYEPVKVKSNLGSDFKSLFDLSFDPTASAWINWIKTQPPYEVPVGASYASVIVPTIDSIRTNSLLNRLLRCKKHTLLCGSTGTGKSISVINELMANF